MSTRKPRILAVDDERINLTILQNDLEDSGFEVFCAEDGKAALAKLKEIPDIDIIVLDRMMPNMDGIQVTKTLKSDPLYKHIPIIMQTAAGQSQQIKEGIEAGVFYYLIKPFNESLLISIVKSALQRNTATNKEEVKKSSEFLKLYGLMDHANFRFRFRTLQDVSNIAYFISNCCPRPDFIVYGLCELMINAVEHGNLGITYTEKLELVMEDRWQQEVERRLSLPENVEKYATIDFETGPKDITITIKDRGKGFKWEDYLDFDPMRMASDPHGKGIAIAKVTSFPRLEYKAGGTEVVCRLTLTSDK
jgi:CheY-like chemotaxis protein